MGMAANISVDNEDTEVVDSFHLLGSVTNNKGCSSKETCLENNLQGHCCMSKNKDHSFLEYGISCGSLWM